MSAGTYTVSQLARALGVSRQAVDKGLTHLPAEAWAFHSLPLNWQEQLTRRGTKRGFDNGEQYLASIPATPWKCPLPWNRVPSKEQFKAARLQKAMARALALRTESEAAPGEVEQAGLADFKAEFGYAVSDRQWRRLLARTIERDGGQEDWQALEIYLDERAFTVNTPKRDVARLEFQHRSLDEVFAALENRLHPTAEDREFLWDAVFRHYEQSAGASSNLSDNARRQFKASLLSYLSNAFPAGTLCKSVKSLQNRFDEKLAVWRASEQNPDALRDRRALDSGNFRRLEFPEDEKKIRNLAIMLDGDEALANRMLRERSQLSEEFCEANPYDARGAKSNLPRSLRDKITPQVDACLPLRRGPWQNRMRGPYIPRDWSGENPGDWFCADDVTWNHYYREQLSDGRWILLRGECLMMIDVRTDYPLDFLLISGHYNGEHVRSLMLRIHDLYGLPRKGFYFENGVWRSHLVTGGNRHGSPVHWREAEGGLSKLNLTIKHAYTPRAKPIEGVFGRLQERMRCIPGFVGFNERDYDAERVQPLIARAKRGDQAALAQFPTAREWVDKIRSVVNDFRHDPQNGKKLRGKSPSEAWAQLRQHGPLKMLPLEARYILATHERQVTVKAEGIKLKIRDQVHLYYNEHTGKAFVEGRPLRAFFNIENPELLVCSDMNRQKYFSVKRVELPAMSATPEQLAEVSKLRRAHMAPIKAIYGECEREVATVIVRDSDYSEAEKQLGRFHVEENVAFKVDQGKAKRSRTRAREKAARAGFDPNHLRLKNPERVAQAAEQIESRIAALERKEQQQAESNHE